MRFAPAQPRAGLVEILMPGEAVADVASWPLLLGVAIALLALVAIVLGVIRTRSRRDPLDTAYRKLAQAHGLSRVERREVKRLAAETGVPAAALLLSPSALAERASLSVIALGVALRLSALSAPASRGIDPRGSA
jgi:hypothetical protein